MKVVLDTDFSTAFESDEQEDVRAAALSTARWLRDSGHGAALRAIGRESFEQATRVVIACYLERRAYRRAAEQRDDDRVPF